MRIPRKKCIDVPSTRAANGRGVHYNHAVGRCRRFKRVRMFVATAAADPGWRGRDERDSTTNHSACGRHVGEHPETDVPRKYPTR